MNFDTAYVHKLTITQPGERSKMFKKLTLRLYPDHNQKPRIFEVELPQVKRLVKQVVLDGIDANSLTIEGNELEEENEYQAISEIRLQGCLDVGKRFSQETKVPPKEL